MKKTFKRNLLNNMFAEVWDVNRSSERTSFSEDYIHVAHNETPRYIEDQ